jgi:hypothetical protein
VDLFTDFHRTGFDHAVVNTGALDIPEALDKFWIAHARHQRDTWHMRARDFEQRLNDPQLVANIDGHAFQTADHQIFAKDS